jgi:hypothetical protein
MKGGSGEAGARQEWFAGGRGGRLGLVVRKVRRRTPAGDRRGTGKGMWGRGGVRVCQCRTVRGEGGEGLGGRCNRRGGQMGAGQPLLGKSVIGVESSRAELSGGRRAVGGEGPECGSARGKVHGSGAFAMWEHAMWREGGTGKRKWEMGEWSRVGEQYGALDGLRLDAVSANCGFCLSLTVFASV